MIIENIDNIEFYLELIEKYGDLGGAFGVLLPMVEAFLPFLPLSLFVTVNVMAFGFIEGYAYSFLGTCIGSISVFLLVRKYARKFFIKRIEKREHLVNVFSWIHNKGFLPIFILYTFPFTPSSLVCVMSAVADVSEKEYILATIFGKAIMILYISFIGYNVKSIFDKPIQSIILIGITVVIALVGRRFSARYEKIKKN